MCGNSTTVERRETQLLQVTSRARARRVERECVCVPSLSRCREKERLACHTARGDAHSVPVAFRSPAREVRSRKTLSLSLSHGFVRCANAPLSLSLSLSLCRSLRTTLCLTHEPTKIASVCAFLTIVSFGVLSRNRGRKWSVRKKPHSSSSERVAAGVPKTINDKISILGIPIRLWRREIAEDLYLSRELDRRLSTRLSPANTDPSLPQSGDCGNNSRPEIRR